MQALQAGQPLDLTGLTFTASVSTSAGVAATFNPSASGNVLTIDLPADLAPGQLQIDCTVSDGVDIRDLLAGALALPGQEQPATVSVIYSPGATITFA